MTCCIMQRSAQKPLPQFVPHALNMLIKILYTVMDGQCVAAVIIQEMMWLLTLSVQSVCDIVWLSLCCRDGIHVLNDDNTSCVPYQYH